MANKLNKLYQDFSNWRFFPLLIKFSVWTGMILFWWIILSISVDTPKEYRLRHSTDDLRREYAAIHERYDSLTSIIDNVVRRDENVFRKLFESNPYDLSADLENERISLHEQLMQLDNDELIDMLGNRMQIAYKKEDMVLKSSDDMKYNISTGVLSIDCVPAIQPVNNKQLTLLAAGKKPLINPFHRAMREHHGVDYLIPEGTAVFATADGVVKKARRESGYGYVIVIDHGYGYETRYAHLKSFNVKQGQRVQRGQTIALSGNSGRSTGPHLHYEVLQRGRHVNPANYYFMDLDADQYEEMIRMADNHGKVLD